jgi:hypothetical protein
MKAPTRKSTFRASNPILEEVWAARRAISEACGHDIARLFAGARERQRKSGRPVVNLEKRRAAKTP